MEAVFPFEKLRAGDSWTWTAAIADRPAPDWVAKFFLRGAQNLDLTASPDGSAHKFTAAIADTKNLPPGTYGWGLVATKGTERVTVQVGQLEVLPDLEQQGAGYDGRSWAKRCLDAVEACIEGRASHADKNYQYGGRAVGFMTPDEQLALRAKLRSMVNAELAESGQRGPQANAIFARFS